MTNLKFRAWDKQAKSMIQDYVNGFDSWGLLRVKEFDSGSYDKPIELILMQSTGLKDKNGVEIFEGDELKLSETLTGEYNELLNLDNKFVIYDKGFMTFSVLSKQEIEWVEKGSNHFKYCYTDQENYYFLNQLESYEVEIVGHIHETKENN